MDDFQEFIPSTPQFQVGYIEGSSKQHWIISREDLDTIYESASDREVVIWCDKKSSEAQDHRELVNEKVVKMVLLHQRLQNLESTKKSYYGLLTNWWISMLTSIASLNIGFGLIHTVKEA